MTKHRRNLFWLAVVLVLVIAFVLRIVLDPGPGEMTLTPFAVAPDTSSPTQPALPPAPRAWPRDDQPKLLQPVSADEAGPHADVAAAAAGDAADPAPTLRVVDVERRPIPRAVVFPGDARPSRWGQAGAGGEVRLPSPDTWSADPLSLLVGAKGYRLQPVEVHSAGPWPQEVVLSDATRLDVTLDVRSERVPPSTEPLSVYLVMASAGSLYEDLPDGDARVFDYRDLLGKESASHIVAADGAMQMLLGGNERTYHVLGVRPGRPIQVTATGPGGSQLAQDEIVLAPGQHGRMTLVIDAPVHSLEGRVTDITGAPLKSVRIQLRPENGQPAQWTTANTDADGRYRFKTLIARRVWIAAVEPDWQRHEALVDLDAGEVHDIALLPNATFVLQVLQAGSLQPAHRASVQDRWADWNFEWEQLGSGEYASRSLPDRRVDIRITHRGNEYSATYEPGDTHARCLVDQTGDVIVHGLVPAPEGGDVRTRLRFYRPGQDQVVAGTFTEQPGPISEEELPPGDYVLRQQAHDAITGQWYDLAHGAVTVVAGGTVHAVLTPGS